MKLCSCDLVITAANNKFKHGCFLVLEYLKPSVSINIYTGQNINGPDIRLLHF